MALYLVKLIITWCSSLRSTPERASFKNGTIFGGYLGGCILSRPLIFQKAGHRPCEELLQKADLF
jgi:hypothetical protein